MATEFTLFRQFKKKKLRELLLQEVSHSTHRMQGKKGLARSFHHEADTVGKMATELVSFHRSQRYKYSQ